MSEKPPPMAQARRLRIIKRALLEGQSQREIALKCNVSERTIERDLKAWKESGGFEEWLLNEFMSLHHSVKAEDLLTAYREISSLLGKTLKQKVESEVKGNIIIQAWDLGNAPNKDKLSPSLSPG